MSVIIGVDPHKASHTAVAIGGDEREVAKVTVRATCQQTVKLLAWAEPFAERTWAIESAGGLGSLLAQQLVDAGEHVLDVPPTLASRVRVLGTGRSEKNDPNDAFSVAIAALRSNGLRTVERADHTEIMRLLAKRNHDLGRLRARLVLFTCAALIVAPVLGIAGLLVYVWTQLPLSASDFFEPTLNAHWQPDPSQSSFYCYVVQGAQTAANTGASQDWNVVFIAGFGAKCRSAQRGAQAL